MIHTTAPATAFAPVAPVRLRETRPAVAPWRLMEALGDETVLDRCVGCGDCAAVCPEDALFIAFDGRPALVATGPCNGCGLCADVCTRGALDASVDRG